ncbi:MAG: hypothetical protein V3U76_19465 [Granulosicoccus sp.]
MYSSTRWGSCLTSIVALTALMIVSGCVTQSRFDQKSLQQAAIVRWSQCIDRHTQETGVSATSIDTVNRSCDGHKRDVLLSFPPHLESRIEQILTQRTLHRTAVQQADSVNYRIDTYLQVVLNEHGSD